MTDFFIHTLIPVCCVCALVVFAIFGIRELILPPRCPYGELDGTTFFMGKSVDLKGIFAVRVHGSGMRPKMRDGDLLYVRYLPPYGPAGRKITYDPVDIFGKPVIVRGKSYRDVDVCMFGGFKDNGTAIFYKYENSKPVAFLPDEITRKDFFRRVVGVVKYNVQE